MPKTSQTTGINEISLPNQTLGGYSLRYDRNFPSQLHTSNGSFKIVFLVSEHMDDYNMTQHRYQATSPSASLAMDMGTDSHKLQLMKASFFADDEYDGKSVVSEQLEGRDSPDQIVPNRPGFRSQPYSVSSSLHSLSRGLPSSIGSVMDIPVASPIASNKDLELKSIEPQVM